MLARNMWVPVNTYASPTRPVRAVAGSYRPRTETLKGGWKFMNRCIHAPSAAVPSFTMATVAAPDIPPVMDVVPKARTVHPSAAGELTPSPSYRLHHAARGWTPPPGPESSADIPAAKTGAPNAVTRRITRSKAVRESILQPPPRRIGFGPLKHPPMERRRASLRGWRGAVGRLNTRAAFVPP